MTIDVFASLPHYWRHLEPIWEALPEPLRGRVYGPRNTIPWGGRPPARWPTDRPVMVAGFTDYQRVAPRPVVYVEHGAGQTYEGDRRGAGHPSYSGGRDLDRVRLFIAPSITVAGRWLGRYPSTPVMVAGDPTVAPRARESGGPPTVAVTWHWDCPLVPETRSAWRHYAHGMRGFAHEANAAGWRVVGHGHPRAWRHLSGWWPTVGVEPVGDWGRVQEEADVLVADNTSAMWEWCALDRPLVVVDAPWYRRDVHHGLRFWEHADAGARVGDPESLMGAVSLAAEDPPRLRANRRAAAEAVYAHVGKEAATRAAAAITALLEA